MLWINQGMAKTPKKLAKKWTINSSKTKEDLSEGSPSRRTNKIWDSDVLVTPLASCLADGSKPNYSPVTAGDHILAKLNAAQIT